MISENRPPAPVTSQDSSFYPLVDETSAALTGVGASASMAAANFLGETIDHEGDERADSDPISFSGLDDLSNQRLGQYRLGALIGEGTMGRVYRGEHDGLGRPCAIKVVNPMLAARQPRVVEQFRAEARAVAGLIHPHIVTVHNIGSDRGYHYLEMEFVPGGQSLKRTLIHDGVLEATRATTLVRQVVLALGAAHRSGLVHRDVKPANVLLTSEGKAKLADFGLVRSLNGEERNGTSPGAPIAGTPTFMAPELFAGAPASPAADLYAVGVMYYYLLSGRLPYVADRIQELIRRHKTQSVPDIRRVAPLVSDDVAGLLNRCLAKEPADRPQSADELAGQLQSILFCMRDLDGLVREALADVDAVVDNQPDHDRILFQLPGGRLQEVHVEVSPCRRGERLLSVYSVCCPADPDHYEFALRLNSEMAYGGLSIREVDGKPMFVMARAYPGGHVTPEEIRGAVLEIARQSDWVEQQLTRSDIF